VAGRPKHPDKDIEAAVQYAESKNWTWTKKLDLDQSQEPRMGSPLVPTSYPRWAQDFG
jgi:hypothetical protein